MLYGMSQVSPTAEGFRVAFHRPLFTLAEVTWRWVVGATGTTLLFFGFFEFLNTLPVTGGELLFLKSGQPFLISQAIAHILRGTLYRGVTSLLLAGLLIAMLWMVAATLGRIATMRAIFDYVRGQIGQKATAAGITSDSKPFTEPERSPVSSLLRLNFLRLSVGSASVIAFWGASIVAGFASTNSGPQPGLVFLIFLPLGVIIGVAWFCLNWLFSLAAIFAVRDGEDALGAINATVSFCRDRPGALFAVSFWTGLAHLVAFVAATTAVSMPLSLITLVPWRLVAVAIILLTLAYFAVADWIYMARLAGYAAILEIPQALWAPPIPPRPIPALSSTIDKDELILSDLPNLTTQS